MKNLLLALVVVLVLAGAYVGRHTIKTILMGGSAPAPTETVGLPSSGSADLSSGTSGASASSGTAMTKAISVTGNEFVFNPKNFAVSKGDTVKLTFTNTGKYPHNFTITELNVKTKTLSPGQADTVTFTPDKTGIFTYFCSVPGHEEKGMSGTLTVQ